MVLSPNHTALVCTADTLLGAYVGLISRRRWFPSVSLCICVIECVFCAFSWLLLSNQCGPACGSYWLLMHVDRHKLAIR